MSADFFYKQESGFAVAQNAFLYVLRRSFLLNKKIRL